MYQKNQDAYQSLEDDEAIPIFSTTDETKILDAVQKKKRSIRYYVRSSLIIVTSLLLFLTVIGVMVYVGILPVFAGQTGVIVCIYHEDIGNQDILYYGKYNPISKLLTKVDSVETLSGSSLLEISSFDRDGNFYWSSGNSKFFLIDTFQNNITNFDILPSPSFMINTLVTQPISSTLYGLVTTDNGSVSVFGLIRGNNEIDDVPIGIPLCNLSAEAGQPTNMAAIDPRNNILMTIFIDPLTGIQNLNLLTFFDGGVNSNVTNMTLFLGDFEIYSVGFEYIESNSLIGVGKNIVTGEFSMVSIGTNVENNRSNATITEVFLIPMDEGDSIVISSFHLYSGEFYLTCITKFKILIFDIRTKSLFFASQSPSQVTFDAIELNPKLKL